MYEAEPGTEVERRLRARRPESVTVGEDPGTAVMGAFDAGCVFPGAGLVEIAGDRVALPYSGFAVPHKFPRLGPLGEVALAGWPRRRLAAIVADEEGTFVTPELQAAGTKLWLDLETVRGGRVRVEVEGVAGRGLADCDPLVGDLRGARVTWNGSPALGVDPAAGFRLRFHLRGARLYAFEIR